jgi:hypothetical protein
LAVAAAGSDDVTWPDVNVNGGASKPGPGNRQIGLARAARLIAEAESIADAITDNFAKVSALSGVAQR